MARSFKISPELSKAARALLQLNQEELAKHTDISVSTIRRFEARHSLEMNVEHRTRVLDFFKSKGLVFIWKDELIIGVMQSDDVDNLIFDY